MSQLLAGILMLAMWPALPGSGWVRVDTPHFVVFGQASEKTTAAVATEFERFRDAIGRVLPLAVVESPVPTIVVLFDTQANLAPYAPRFNGKPIELAGYFQGTETDNVIALSLEKRDEALRIVFHEYTHLVISGTARRMPIWVNEGLAEYDSTFEMRQDGRGGVSGTPIVSHLLLLQQHQMLTIDELIGVDRDSPLYQEGDRRSVFYAQSWALVHMMVSSRGPRADAFERYLALCTQGAEPRAAWRQAFGKADVLAELKSYLRAFAMTGMAYRFDQIKAPPTVASVPSPADVETAKAILLRTTDPEDAARRLEKAAAGQAPPPLARAVLGLLKVETNPGAAEQLLLGATRDPADWLAQYYAAAGLALLVSGSTLESDRPRIDAARAALRVVMNAKPELAHPHALMAFVTDPQESIVSAARARAMAPGRSDYAYIEAQARANSREFVRARELLAPLLMASQPREVQERARALIEEIAAMERSERSADPLRVGDPPDRTSDNGWRALLAGEIRTEGSLQRIDCTGRSLVTLHVLVDGATLLFTAPSLRDIEFITYRADRREPVTCGPRTPPEKVYVSWRALKPVAKGIAGRVTAVEFLDAK